MYGRGIVTDSRRRLAFVVKDNIKIGVDEMAYLPKIANCPLMDDESRICMCLNLKCNEGEVDSKTCYGIRNAFQYGCVLTEEKYLAEFKTLAQTMLNRIEALQNET